MQNRFAEPLTARKNARLNFLQKQTLNLRTYKSDLEYCVLNSKQTLQQLFSSKLVSSTRNLDLSAETDHSSHVPLRVFEAALAKNKELYNELKNIWEQNEHQEAQCLITEQLTNENLNKEEEQLEELQEAVDDLKYLLEKKQERIKLLNRKNWDLKERMALLKEKRIIILPLSEDYLSKHNTLQTIKSNLASLSKKLQITEMQKDQLVEYCEFLASKLKPYKTFFRNSKSLKTNFSYQLEFPNDSYSLEELSENFQSSPAKSPSLPKLDFSKITSEEQDSSNQAFATIQHLERICQEKSQYLETLRSRAIELLNQKKQLSKKSPYTETPFKPLKKTKPKSNTRDYFCKSKSSRKLSLASEESSEKNPNDISSLMESYVMSFEDLEPDSVLADYLDQII